MEKMKKQKILVSVSVIFLALFVTTLCNAGTTYTVEYPTSVELGETIELNLIFNYELATDCLYSSKVYIYWSVNNEISSTWTSGISKYVSNSPRPTNVSWIFDTLIMYGGALEIDDVIRFKFMYKMGVENIELKYITFLGIIITDTYEVTIGEITTEKTDFIIALTPIIVLAIALMASKVSFGKES